MGEVPLPAVKVYKGTIMQSLQYEVVTCFIVILILTGCDGGLEVRGQLETDQATNNLQCEISLWSVRELFWGITFEPSKDNSSNISDNFNIFWIIDGPIRNRRLEISCPGYEIFRSKEFEAPSVDGKVDLGLVKMKRKE